MSDLCKTPRASHSDGTAPDAGLRFRRTWEEAGAPGQNRSTHMQHAARQLCAGSTGGESFLPFRVAATAGASKPAPHRGRKVTLQRFVPSSPPSAQHPRKSRQLASCRSPQGELLWLCSRARHLWGRLARRSMLSAPQAAGVRVTLMPECGRCQPEGGAH